MNLSEIAYEARRVLTEVGTNALTAEQDDAGLAPTGALTVFWNVYTGGVLNPSTGAMVGAATTTLSGTLVALGVEEKARTVLRQFSEIAVGDLLVTLLADPEVVLGPGQTQSGTLPLAAVSPLGPWFEWQGNRYTQKEMSDELRGIWKESIQGMVIAQGILLRRST